MTEPKTSTLDVPGAVLHYDVRSNESSTEPVLLLVRRRPWAPPDSAPWRDISPTARS